MSNFARPKSRIKGVSDVRRLPRLGKIRLGVKAISRTTGKEYPKETEWFVVPPEVEKIYGPAPTELDVMFPLNEVEAIFPQRYIWYGQSKGAKCIGDGEKANRVTDQGIQEIECPCEKLGKECQQRAHLMVLLPKVSLGGVYQIDLGSYHSIVDINSGLDYVQAMVGRFAMVPLKLKRVPKETHGSGRKETHYPLMLILEGDIGFINTLRESTNRILTSAKYLLPAPTIENPAMDDGAVTVVEDETEEKPITATEVPGRQQQFEGVMEKLAADMTRSPTPADNNLESDADVTPPPTPKEVAKELGGKVVDDEILRALRKELASFDSQADVIYWMTTKVKPAGLMEVLNDEVNVKLQEIVKNRTTRRDSKNGRSKQK